RQAILDANNDRGPNTIAFDIGDGGAQTIAPTSPLPTLINPTIIDGTTQPGFAGTPVIELTGTDAGSGANGLTISRGNCTVKGLAINAFGGSGLVLADGGSNLVVGNYIGTDLTGTT